MIRAGVVRKALMRLKQTFSTSKTLFDQRTITLLQNFLSGKGRIKSREAWYIQDCTQKPSNKEIDLIIKSFQTVVS